MCINLRRHKVFYLGFKISFCNLSISIWFVKLFVHSVLYLLILRAVVVAYPVDWVSHLQELTLMHVQVLVSIVLSFLWNSNPNHQFPDSCAFYQLKQSSDRVSGRKWTLARHWPLHSTFVCVPFRYLLCVTMHSSVSSSSWCMLITDWGIARK